MIGTTFYLFVMIGLTSVAACPTGCLCAKKNVKCDGQNLQYIPERIPADTTHLNLQNNLIEVIDHNRIKHLTSLQELLLGQNRISKIQTGTFMELFNLKTLNLESNRLTSLSPGTFDGLWNLAFLYLSNNKLVSIDGAFRNLTKLGRLDLSMNRVTELGGNAFSDLKSLIHLMLPSNQISKVSSDTFSPLQSLNSLILRNNPIKDGDKLFTKNHRLSYVDLSGCHLKEVPSGLPWATQHLQLGNNNITRIRKNDFVGTYFLVILVLDENQISKVDKGAFSELRKLEQLWLNDNLLKKIPSPFASKVTNLYMSKNKLSKISSKDFPMNSALTTVTLNSNIITSIESGAFKQVKFLQELQLNGNKLFTIQEDIFAGLSQLQTLSLNNNKVTKIESGAFNGLHSLKKLEMAFIVDIKTKVQGNLFADLRNLNYLDLQLSASVAKQILNSDDMLSSLRNITTINLMNNELTTLNPNLRTYLTNVEVIKIAGNRWHCDKRLQWLSAWLKSHKNLFFLIRDIQCHTPASLQGLPLSILKPFQFAPVTTTPTPPTTTPLTTSTSTTTASTTTKRQVKSTSAPKIKYKPQKPQKPKKEPARKPKPTLRYPPTQLMLTKTKIVTRIQRFFVFPSTSAPPKTKQREEVTKSRRKNNRRRLPTTQSTRTTVKPLTKHTQKPRVTKNTPQQRSRTKSTNPLTTVMKFTPSTVQISTATVKHFKTTPFIEPEVNNRTFMDKNTTVTERKISDIQEHTAGVDMTTVIIATCVAAVVLLIILGVVIFFVIRYRQNKLVYHRALQYRQDYSDVVFFVGEPIQDFSDLKQKAARTRSDRGSTSSRPSEDITNDLDTNMKVYTWDDE